MAPGSRPPIPTPPHLLPALPDDPRAGGEGELGGQRGQVEVLDPVLLPGDARARPVDQHPVLVDHVHDGGDLAGVGPVLEDGHATDLNKFLERLKRKKREIHLTLRPLFHGLKKKTAKRDETTKKDSLNATINVGSHGLCKRNNLSANYWNNYLQQS